MKTNFETIETILKFIEENLGKTLNVDIIAAHAGYSNYHLHRMFTAITGLSLHQYIIRRRLTEAARLLIFSEFSIAEIALESGYDSQQSFTNVFKKYFKKSPLKFRRQGTLAPLQLRLSLEKQDSSVKGDRMMEIRTERLSELYLTGYKCNTRLGFLGIAKAWRNLTKNLNTIRHLKQVNYLVGVNDYHLFEMLDEKRPKFDYFAAAEVTKADTIPKKMVSLTIPESQYIVFKYRGKTEDSMEKVFDYIYKTWFPESTYTLNDNVKMDFVRYGTEKDSEGISDIEVFVPVK